MTQAIEICPYDLNSVWPLFRPRHGVCIESRLFNSCRIVDCRAVIRFWQGQSATYFIHLCCLEVISFSSETRQDSWYIYITVLRMVIYMAILLTSWRKFDSVWRHAYMLQLQNKPIPILNSRSRARSLSIPGCCELSLWGRSLEGCLVDLISHSPYKLGTH